MPIRLFRSLARIAFLFAVGLSLALVAAVVTLRYAVVPNIERYRAEIVQSVSLCIRHGGQCRTVSWWLGGYPPLR